MGDFIHAKVYILTNQILFRCKIVGSKGQIPWNKGKTNIFSDEARAKMSASMKGRIPYNKGKTGLCVCTDKTRAKISEANKGKLVTKETRDKLSVSNKGKIRTEEAKRKQSESCKGRVISEETRAKISKSNKGRVLSEETRKKISLSKMGNVISIEARRKISESQKGRISPKKGVCGFKHTQETCKKMSESRKGEKSHFWKGGVSFLPYCPKFNPEFKENVRLFFNYTCQMPECGHVWQPGERRLSVHHVNYDKMSCCNDVKPLFVPVCSGTCHTKTNRNREYWEKLFTDLIMTKYGGKCYTKV